MANRSYLDDEQEYSLRCCHEHDITDDEDSDEIAFVFHSFPSGQRRGELTTAGLINLFTGREFSSHGKRGACRGGGGRGMWAEPPFQSAVIESSSTGSSVTQLNGCEDNGMYRTH